MQLVFAILLFRSHLLVSTSGILLSNLNLKAGTFCVIKYLKINVAFLGSSLFESFKFN